MSDTIWTVILGSVLASAGTAAVFLLQRWVTRGERVAREQRIEAETLIAKAKAEVTQKKAIDDANTKLASELRDEMRRDMLLLRDQDQSKGERITRLEARVETLTLSEDHLRRENMELKGQNGAQGEEIKTLREKVNVLAERDVVRSKQVDDLQVDRLTLIDAIRKAGIPLPPLVSDRAR